MEVCDKQQLKESLLPRVVRYTNNFYEDTLE